MEKKKLKYIDNVIYFIFNFGSQFKINIHIYSLNPSRLLTNLNYILVIFENIETITYTIQNHQQFYITNVNDILVLLEH